jgi:hypothetical protein
VPWFILLEGGWREAEIDVVTARSAGLSEGRRSHQLGYSP